MKEKSKERIKTLIEKQMVKIQELKEKHQHEEEVHTQFLIDAKEKIKKIIRPKMEEIKDYIKPNYESQIIEHTESDSAMAIKLTISLREEFKPVIPKSDLHISFYFNPLHLKVLLFSNILHPDPIKPGVVSPAFDIKEITSELVEEKILDIFEKHFTPTSAQTLH